MISANLTYISLPSPSTDGRCDRVTAAVLVTPCHEVAGHTGSCTQKEGAQGNLLSRKSYKWFVWWEKPGIPPEKGCLVCRRPYSAFLRGEVCDWDGRNCRKSILWKIVEIDPFPVLLGVRECLFCCLCGVEGYRGFISILIFHRLGVTL